MAVAVGMGMRAGGGGGMNRLTLTSAAPVDRRLAVFCAVCIVCGTYCVLYVLYADTLVVVLQCWQPIGLLPSCRCTPTTQDKPSAAPKLCGNQGQLSSVLHHGGPLALAY